MNLERTCVLWSVLCFLWVSASIKALAENTPPKSFWALFLLASSKRSLLGLPVAGFFFALLDIPSLAALDAPSPTHSLSWSSYDEPPAFGPFRYVYPRPGHTDLPGYITIGVRGGGGEVDPSSVGGKFVVTGARSGNRGGVVRVAKDDRTVLFLPHQAFHDSEMVTVDVLPGIWVRNETTGGLDELGGYSWSFRTGMRPGDTLLRSDEVLFTQSNDASLSESISILNQDEPTATFFDVPRLPEATAQGAPVAHSTAFEAGWGSIVPDRPTATAGSTLQKLQADTLQIYDDDTTDGPPLMDGDDILDEYVETWMANDDSIEGATGLRASVAAQWWGEVEGGLPQELGDARTWVRTDMYKTLPEDFPPIARTVVGNLSNAAGGYIFVATIGHPDRQFNNFLLILETSGEPVWWQRLDERNENWRGWSVRDFKKHPTGVLSWHDSHKQGWHIVNDSYEEVGFIEPKHTYRSNGHCFVIGDNGHALLLANRFRSGLDLSAVLDGGSHKAQVLDFAIQELDEDGAVLFEWTSWNDLPIGRQYLESRQDPKELFSNNVDHLHPNSVDWTPDNHILVSLRHLDQVIKIDRDTGEILWRLGGASSDFSFVNDTDRGFTYQHDAKMTQIDPPIVTLYDNGNRKSPERSRAVAYQLDEHSRTATLIWEHRHQPEDVYGLAMGSHQTLSNGNTVVGWAGVEPQRNPFYTELDGASGTTVVELQFLQPWTSYRAFKGEWAGRPRTAPTLLLDVSGGDNVKLRYSWNGATQVRRWKVYAGTDPEAPDQLIWEVAKWRYEQWIDFNKARDIFEQWTPIDQCIHYQVVPVDNEGNPMTPSAIVSSPWCESQGALCALDDQTRRDCAADHPFIKAQECHNRGCCYRPSDTMTSPDSPPWCFHPRAATDQPQAEGYSLTCTTDKSIAAPCGVPGDWEAVCRSRGCCWSEQGGAPVCYHAQWTCDGDVAENRRECGYAGLGEDGCHSRGCCYGETDRQGVPWCYQPR
ncbi:unnamed protein product [Vitrella brassicaformis CCMP3155]|uniref:P-type domain-containing protein n=1 Tax=Vitrella brassicaformis (strain CCMP3155) TaxID=1169540 RepID=A0A0G4F9W9_VITBC|nr:unnamed protein product [Vitrella brassicaformis CCMP3155]|eukprot:CEM09679.1 unnamed protein product [Vitrella brassicaformis CCMP3155]